MIIFLGHQTTDTYLSLLESEIIHCTKTLRKQMGDDIIVHDGMGNVYQCTIATMSKKEVSCIINQKVSHPPLKSLHLAISLTKNIDRIEWLVAKGVEIGVTDITFVRCQRSERKNYRHDRIIKIAQSSTKQSLKYYCTNIRESVVDFKTFVQNNHSVKDKFVASYSPANHNLIQQNITGESALILIGPEGDFTQEEIDLATANDFTATNLGSQRLRTETAGIYAATILRARMD